MDSVLNLSVILSIVGVLVALTNIIAEVLKKITWKKIPTNILVIVIAMVLTLVAFFAYCSIKSVTAAWYAVAGAIVLGFLVAYAAMFGYDKLRETLEGIPKK